MGDVATIEWAPHHQFFFEHLGNEPRKKNDTAEEELYHDKCISADLQMTGLSGFFENHVVHDKSFHMMLLGSHHLPRNIYQNFAKRHEVQNRH